MKSIIQSFYTITLSVIIGLAVAMISDMFVGLTVAVTIGFMTELTFSEIEHKKGLTCDNK